MEDLLNQFDGLRRSVNIGIESENEWVFDLDCLTKRIVNIGTESEEVWVIDSAGLRKRQLICCWISSSKNSFIAFQHKLFFHPVNDLFSYFEDPRRSVNIAIESENKWNFDPACFLKKNWLIRCQMSSSKSLWVLIQHKSFLNIAVKIFNLFNGLWRSFNIGKKSESQWIFDLAHLRKISVVKNSSSKLYVVI